MTNDELFQLVQQAQYGDRQAIQRIVESFYPLIRKAARNMPPAAIKDYEQTIIEKLVRAIHNFDLQSVPSFTDFCRNIE